MQICVRTTEGLTLDFELPETETIESLKSKIFQREGIHSSYQRLTYKNEILEDHYTLESYNIKDRSLVYLYEKGDELFDLFMFFRNNVQ